MEDSKMMTNNKADPTRAGALAQQIVAILANEDSTTRQRAIQAAMMLLGEATPQPSNGHSQTSSGELSADGHADLASFFNREEDMEPADYAQLCAAYHFSQFGVAPFSVVDIRTIAMDAGVVVPDRLDKTFAAATKKGKKLFQRAGKSLFKPTATGSLVFGERWGVKPGRKTKTAPTIKSDGVTDAKAR